MQWEELRAEAGAEVVPVDKIRTTDVCGNGFPLIYPVGPFLGSVLIHVGHGPLNLCLFVRELIWTQAEVCLAGVYETFAFLSVAVEVWGW